MRSCFGRLVGMPDNVNNEERKPCYAATKCRSCYAGYLLTGRCHSTKWRLTPQLSDVGGLRCSILQAMCSARIRSSDFVSRSVYCLGLSKISPLSVRRQSSAPLCVNSVYIGCETVTEAPQYLRAGQSPSGGIPTRWKLLVAFR